MKVINTRFMAAILMLVLLALTRAAAEPASPLSQSQWKKLLELTDKLGSRNVILSPIPGLLGLTKLEDNLPSIEVETDDGKFGFVRSRHNPDDFIFYAIVDDKMFVFRTSAELRILAAVRCGFVKRPSGGAEHPNPSIIPIDEQAQVLFQVTLAAFAKEKELKGV